MFDGASKLENEAMLEYSREQEQERRKRRDSSDIIKKQEERIKDLEMLVNSLKKENENLVSRIGDMVEVDEFYDIQNGNRINAVEKRLKELNDRIDAVVKRMDRHEYGINSW